MEVKKTIICVSLLVALVATPMLVSAQVLPGLPRLQGLPGFGLPANVSLGNLSVYGGWATNAGMTNYVVSRESAITNVGKAEWDYDFSSFYVAATLPVSMGDYGAALLSGSFTIPSTSPGRESIYTVVPPGFLSNTRRWSADTYWATLEGIWAYPLSVSFSALAGFRWVTWQTSYKSPTNERNGLALYANTDSGDVTVNGYVPFVGLLASYRGLNVGAVGIPTTIGDVEHNEVFGGMFGGTGSAMEAKGVFAGGYFFEAFADYALPLPGGMGPGVDADLSLFGKCSFLEVEATTAVRWWGILGKQDYDFRLHRNLFVLGAKATLNFNLAGLLPF